MKRMRAGLLAACLSALSPLAQSQHPDHADHGADGHASPGGSGHAMEQPIIGLFLVDRLEFRTNEGEGLLEWDAQAWVGSDLNRLWLKSEGAYLTDAGATEGAELQVLFGRAVSPFFDLQIGLRHDFEPGDGRQHAVLGIEGLAPYWFEVDAALFVSDEGDLSARIELEYELLLTQRLILQPRVELEFAAQDVPRFETASGLSAAEAGLRLRYEIRREFAPYVGLSWHRSYAEATEAGDGHGDSEALSVVAGLRFWF